jgi:hypothetical protein
MDQIFLITTLQAASSGKDMYEIICLNHSDCTRYFKGKTADLLACLPDIIDGDSDDLRGNLITDKDPCEQCYKPACTKRNHFVIPDEQSVNNIFNTLAESQKENVYMTEYD